MKQRYLLGLLFLSLMTPIQAQQFSEAMYAFGDTTDGIDYSELNLDYNSNKKDLYWPYKNEREESFSYGFGLYDRQQKGPGFDFSFTQLNAHASYQWQKKHTLIQNLGFYSVRKEDHYDDESLKLATTTTLQSHWYDQLNTQLSLGRGIALRRIFLLGGSLHNLKATQLSLRAQHSFFKDTVFFNLIATKDYLQNDNERDFYDGEIMVSLMKWPHWIRLGWGYHEMSYKKDSPFYWSPEDFYAHGPRVDLSFELPYTIQFYAGGSYNWFEENETFEGSGYYLKSGFRYGVREDFTVDLSYERNESIQDSTSWVSEAYALNLTYFF